jgi:hypothetical protein
MENERDYPEHDLPKTIFSFGDKVRTELGEEGKIVEVDKGDKGEFPHYKVAGVVEHGWYPAHELRHVK